MVKIDRYVSTSSHGGMVKVTCPKGTDGTYIKSEDLECLKAELMAAGGEMMREAARLAAKKRLDLLKAPGHYFLAVADIIELPNPTPTDLAARDKAIAAEARRKAMEEAAEICSFDCRDKDNGRHPCGKTHICAQCELAANITQLIDQGG